MCKGCWYDWYAVLEFLMINCTLTWRILIELKCFFLLMQTVGVASPSGTSCCCSCCLQSQGWWWSWPTDWSPENSTEASTLRWAIEKTLMVSKRVWKTYRNSFILSTSFKHCNDELIDLSCSGVLLLQMTMLVQIPTRFDFNIRHSFLKVVWKQRLVYMWMHD